MPGKEGSVRPVKKLILFFNYDETVSLILIVRISYLDLCFRNSTDT